MNFARTNRRGTAAVAALIAAAAATSIAPPQAKADDFWRAAKAYTASIYQTAADAAQKLADAKEILENAEQILAAAEAALRSAPAPQRAAAAAAVARALAAVTAAKAAVAAAAKAAAVATAAVAAFLAGTAVGQGADWLISFCWDPVCDFDTQHPAYVFPHTGEVESWMPFILFNGSGVHLTHADFAQADIERPGVGTASWNYVREASRMFAVAVRGAASYSAGDCTSVFAARQDLDAAMFNFTVSLSDYASQLPTLRTFDGNPMMEIQEARTALNDLQQYMPDFQNPSQMQQIITQAMNGLNMAQSALMLASRNTGVGVPLDGPTGWIDPLSLQEFQAFLADCAARGAAALPPREVAVADGLMGVLGISLRGQSSLGPAIAAWDALGDPGGHETALFLADGGQLIASRVLATSVPNHWQLVNLDESPLIIWCNNPCVADTDNGTATGTPDGGVSIEDLLYYLSIFDQGNVNADVDDGSATGTKDGGVSIEDLLYYLIRFDQGC